MQKAAKLLAFAGLTNDRSTVLKFCEPAGTRGEVLVERVLAGTYTKPFLVDETAHRSLCFSLDGCTQSEMRLDAPYELVSEYTRKMMGFLLLRPRPERVHIVGLGGGSLVKYCHRHLPATHVTVVEISADVIGLRSQFFVPPDDERLRVIHCDGAAYVARMADRGERSDAILVDAYDRKGIAAPMVERAFLEHAKAVLGARGVFVMNLVTEPCDAERHIGTIRRIFGDPVLVIGMRRGGNLVIFAGPTLRDRRRLDRAVRNAEHLERRFGLLFPTLRQHLNELAGRWARASPAGIPGPAP